MSPPKRRLWPALLSLGLCGGLVYVLALGFGQDPHAVPSTRLHQLAPDFALRDLDGKQVRRADLQGQPAVINFWATWCYPCQAEAGLLASAAQALQGKVRFVGIVYQDSDAAIRAALERHPAPYPQLVDPGATMAMDYGVAGVPETFVLDAQGVVVAKHAGVLTQQLLQAALAPLLAPPAAAAAPGGAP